MIKKLLYKIRQLNKCILILSDLHAPYWHPDTIKFLKAVKSKYNPDRVISVGDETDYHAISFHQSDPDLLSPGDELKKAIRYLKTLAGVFDQIDFMDSNHGSLVYRKGKFAGLPRHVFKSYNAILEAPEGWKWHPYLVIRMSNGEQLYICHSKGSDVLRVSQSLGMSVVQGHEHSKFELRYWGNSLGLYFAITTGCLIDDKSMAYEYNKLTLKRPIIGITVIQDGIPHLVPMVLKENGRWNGIIN